MLLVTHNLSGFVARDLSGFAFSSWKGVKRETARVATGDPENEAERNSNPVESRSLRPLSCGGAGKSLGATPYTLPSH